MTHDDRGRVLAHLLGLSAQDRQMRFGRAFTDASIVQYVADLNFATSACFGILDEHDDLIALVQSFAYEDGSIRMIEAAFSTDARWRCRGLATLLFHEVTNYAVEQRIDLVITQCLAGNRSMRALLCTVGAVCELDDGEVVGQLKVAGHA